MDECFQGVVVVYIRYVCVCVFVGLRLALGLGEGRVSNYLGKVFPCFRSGV